MKSSKKIDVFSKSALVNLKAELSKKQEEARQAKLKADGETVIRAQVPQKVTEYSKKNLGVDERNQKDAEEIAEEEASCKKSRAILERKAELYEKLSQGQVLGDTETDGRYLVDFEQKASEKCSQNIETEEIVISDGEREQLYDSDDYGHPSDPEEDWVDYHDCLGRTRSCLRKDLQFLKMKDAKLADSLGMCEPPAEVEKSGAKQVAGGETSNPTSDCEKSEPVRKDLELMSEDMRKEELRKKWEQQEAELREKSDVHYQDVLFDEVRTHGVAYYAFSKEEKARQAEQEELRKLRVETEKGQAAASELRARRKEQMAARLKAARARKREREGLPPEPEEDEKDLDEGKVEDEMQSMWPDCKAAEVAKAEEEERLKSRAKIEDAEERRKKRLERRPPPVRPWDVGKEGAAGTADVMTQEEWVKKKREERKDEFAPPPEFNLSEDNDYIATDSDWSASHLRATSKKLRHSGGSRTTSHEWRKEEIILKRSMDATSSDENLKDKASFSVVNQKRAEIPPPTTFDYYGPSSSKQKFQPAKPINQASLDDAISAGLSYLRQQAEERDKQKEKGLLGII